MPGKAHRLLCGDSTVAEDVARLLGGDKPEAIIADPPYGMGLDADFTKMAGGSLFGSSALSHGRRYDPVIGDDKPFDAAPVQRLFGNPEQQFWFGADYYAASLGDTEHRGAWLVWDKRLDEAGDKRFGSCFELIWSRSKCRREVLRYLWSGVFGLSAEQEHRRVHPTQKPTALLSNLVARVKGLVVDPFLGSGTTMVAAEQLSRVCYGCDIEPGYVAVALQRMTDMGLTPQRAE